MLGRGGPTNVVVATLERLIVPRCDAVITVSGGIADRIAERYGLAERPTLVRNACDLPPPAPGAPDLRRELGVGDAPLVLHQGAVLSYRELRADAPITDAQWRDMVRAGKAPLPPAFTRSFRR